MIQEDKLIERAQEGDQEAFCLLARSYQRRIYALALHYTRDPHEAEDLSQGGLAEGLSRHRRLPRRGGLPDLAAPYHGKHVSQPSTWMMDTTYSSGKKAFRLGEMVSLEELGLTPAEPRQAHEGDCNNK